MHEYSVTPDGPIGNGLPSSFSNENSVLLGSNSNLDHHNSNNNNNDDDNDEDEDDDDDDEVFESGSHQLGHPSSAAEELTNHVQDGRKKSHSLAAIKGEPMSPIQKIPTSVLIGSPCFECQPMALGFV